MDFWSNFSPFGSKVQGLFCFKRKDTFEPRNNYTPVLQWKIGDSSVCSASSFPEYGSLDTLSDHLSSSQTSALAMSRRTFRRCRQSAGFCTVTLLRSHPCNLYCVRVSFCTLSPSHLPQRLVAVLAAPVERARQVVARAQRDDADGGARPRQLQAVHHGQDPAHGAVAAAR